MKKNLFLVILLSLFFLPSSHAEQNDAVQKFHGEGEVVSVDPVYSRVTINHSLIKDFAHDGETEFSVQSADSLKKISKSDLVSFEIEETKGDAQIVKIQRVGQAPTKEDHMPLGSAAQEVLEGAGSIVKTVASPIAPIGQVANAATDATTNTTGSILKDAESQVKTKF